MSIRKKLLSLASPLVAAAIASAALVPASPPADAATPAASSTTVTRFTGAVKVQGARSKVHPITLAAGTTVKATLRWRARRGDLDLTLRNPAGTAVASSTTLRPERITANVPTTGTWSLRVWARQGGSGYVLTVEQTTTPTPDPTPMPEPTPTPTRPADGSKPPAGGYFTALPPLAALPSDSECAGRVHRSTWEPRPENARANATHPPLGYRVDGYGGMANPDQTWGRVTGQASGTTDELIQHYACKWGLPDDLMRAEMVAESYWYQGQKDSNGNPINGRGYGDFGHCSGGPYGSSGPASLGVMQIKWCAHPGTLPYSETSTAFNLDYYGALIRGCYNGWDYVTSNRGDLWGCVGRWYSGGWYDTDAQGYISSVKSHLSNKPWLGW